MQVLAIVYLIIINPAHRHLDRTSRDMIHERTVMADHHYGLTVIDQEILQPLDRLDIQVIRRLVQQKDIRFLQQ